MKEKFNLIMVLIYCVMLIPVLSAFSEFNIRNTIIYALSLIFAEALLRGKETLDVPEGKT